MVQTVFSFSVRIYIGIRSLILLNECTHSKGVDVSASYARKKR